MNSVPHPSRLADFLDPIIEQWIGWSLPPVNQELNRSGWTPDETSSYCPLCGDSVGRGEITASGCASCRNKPQIADGFVRLGSYQTPLRSWILAIKFRYHWEMARSLGKMLGQQILNSGLIHHDPRIVVPMPMPLTRRWYRGIDHTAEIARGVATTLNCPVLHALKKSNGPPQMSLSQTRRIYGAGARMSLRHRRFIPNIAGKTVILIDDVRTTGGSMRAASRLLHKCFPSRIIAATLAVTENPSRRAKITQPTGESA